MPPKRLPPRQGHGKESSASKSERSNSADFSTPVKEKLAKSIRTGQACDRCKIRKIKCDGNLNGCRPCRELKHECQTTDRISGVPTARGHASQLESENRDLRNEITKLQSQLESLGVDVKPLEGLAAQRSLAAEESFSSEHSISTANTAAHSDSSSLSFTASLPRFRTVIDGASYLGVSTGKTGKGGLSSIGGMSLNLFGMDLDISQMISDVVDPELTSYDIVMEQIRNEQPPSRSEIPFPPEDDMKRISTSFCKILNAFVPVLHKPTFIQLVSDLYQQRKAMEHLSLAERVIFHMVVAIIIHVEGCHGMLPELKRRANNYARYGLAHFNALMQGGSLEDLQALTLICYYLRNQAKPGAVWTITHQVLTLAMETGLHRSSSAWTHGNSQNLTPLEIQIRKWVFWTIHAFHVMISGKLGRPIAIRLDDIDIEFPEPIEDWVPEDRSNPDFTDFDKCSFHAGIHYLKLMALSNKMYSTIYAVKLSPQHYDQCIQSLNADIVRWRRNVPQELHLEGAEKLGIIFAGCLRWWDMEFQLLLHHPAVCRSRSQTVYQSNLSACWDGASRMLVAMQALEALNATDLTWTSTTIYPAAQFTMLYIAYERAGRLTEKEIKQLRDETSGWVKVFAVAGKRLGTEEAAGNAAGHINSQAIRQIEEKIKTSAARRHSASTSPPIGIAVDPQSRRPSQVHPSIGSAFPHDPSQEGYGRPGKGPMDRRDSYGHGYAQTPSAISSHGGTAHYGHDSIPPSPNIAFPSQQSPYPSQHDQYMQMPAGMGTTHPGASPDTSNYTGSHNSAAPTPGPSSDYMISPVATDPTLHINASAYGEHDINDNPLSAWHQFATDITIPPQSSQAYIDSHNYMASTAQGMFTQGVTLPGATATQGPTQWPGGQWPDDRDQKYR